MADRRAVPQNSLRAGHLYLQRRVQIRLEIVAIRRILLCVINFVWPTPHVKVSGRHNGACGKYSSKLPNMVTGRYNRSVHRYLDRDKN